MVIITQRTINSWVDGADFDTALIYTMGAQLQTGAAGPTRAPQNGLLRADCIPCFAKWFFTSPIQSGAPLSRFPASLPPPRPLSRAPTLNNDRPLPPCPSRSRAPRGARTDDRHQEDSFDEPASVEETKNKRADRVAESEPTSRSAESPQYAVSTVRGSARGNR